MRRFLFAVALICTGTAAAQTDIASLVRALGRTGALTIAGEPICATAALQNFYHRRNDEPAWNDANAAALIRAALRSEDEGLHSESYHLAAIARTTGGERDILLSDAFLLYGTHLLQGRTDPTSLDSAWCIEPRKLDLPAVLQAALDDGTVEQSLSRLAPRSDGYTRLRAALAEYRAIAAIGGWRRIEGGPTLRQGDNGPRVQQLAVRLGLQIDVFNDDLALRVRDFQSHHGLAADGVAGAATLRELNVPVERRIEQVVANMERWRWMPDDLGDTYVMVNIAAFELRVVHRAQIAMSMKTIVGKLFTSTPFFPAQIGHIVFNPYWNVPDKIANEELWPKQRRDRTCFAREHYEVIDGLVRQQPGPWNSLGQIKFDMPNRFTVYLHDTPARSLFSAETRAFSHGCIRLEKPRDLAIWLLRNQPRWTPAAVQSAIAAGKEKWVRLTNPVSVYVLYWTAFIAEDGHLEFRRDIYGRDEELIAALHQSQRPRSRVTPAQ